MYTCLFLSQNLVFRFVHTETSEYYPISKCKYTLAYLQFRHTLADDKFTNNNLQEKSYYFNNMYKPMHVKPYGLSQKRKQNGQKIQSR